MTQDLIERLTARSKPNLKTRRVTVRVSEKTYQTLVDLCSKTGASVTGTAEQVIEDVTIEIRRAYPSIHELSSTIQELSNNPLEGFTHGE